MKTRVLVTLVSVSLLAEPYARVSYAQQGPPVSPPVVLPPPVQRPLPPDACAGCASGPDGCGCLGSCSLNVTFHLIDDGWLDQVADISLCSNCPPPESGYDCVCHLPPPRRCPGKFTISTTIGVSVEIGGELSIGIDDIVEIVGRLTGGYTESYTVTREVDCGPTELPPCEWISDRYGLNIRRDIQLGIIAELVSSGHLGSIDGVQPCSASGEPCNEVCDADSGSVSYDKVIGPFCELYAGGPCCPDSTN